MAVKKRGLGRGLDALIGAGSPVTTGSGAEPGEAESLRQLPVDLIRRGRYQPRRDFNPEALEELANSIRSQGLLQPVVVRPLPGGEFELIAGERRWRASQMAGLTGIPAIVRDVPDEAAMALALIENIQREDLNAIEEAVALQRLQQEFGLTHEQIAEAVGKSRVTVTNTMRLLGLAPEVRDHLEARRLEMGHGRALLTLAAEQQVAVAREILEKDLTVRETEALVRRMQVPARARTRAAEPDADIRRLERELSEITGAAIAIEHKSGGKGRLVIGYSSLDQLDGLLRYFRPDPG
ncbi:MAG: putative chromosome-partitioning protein ParB [Pseudomonadales bacterium]|nr:putative chromosome-partitioning protein ParB [Pseudomonadales bacterium]